MKTLTILLGLLAVACGDASPDSLGMTERSKFGMEEPAPPPSPDQPQCNAVSTWPDGARAEEVKFLPLINALRAQGAVCGDQNMAPTPPVVANEMLTCAARWHAQDMGKRGFFSHNSPEGTRAGDRLRAVGYKFRYMGENIAWGQTTAEGVMRAWTKSPAHCKNMMDANFTEVGVGYFVQDPNTARGHLWALDLGAPRP